MFECQCVLVGVCVLLCWYVDVFCVLVCVIVCVQVY